MASTTTTRLTQTKGQFPSRGTFPIAANTRILKGIITQINASDQAVPGADGNGFLAVGKSSACYDNTTGSEAGGVAEALDCEVEYGVFGWKGEAGHLPTVGDVCYVADNQTVSTDSDSGARGIAGRCVEVRDSLYWVYMSPEVAAEISDIVSAQTDLDTAEAALDALEAEVGDYTGGGGAEADIATGVTQAETDIAALEADVVSADNQWDLGLQKAVLAATGAPLVVFNDGVADGWDLVGSELIAYRFNVGSTGAIAITGVLPSDLDPTADLILHFVGAREGGDDPTTVLTCTLFFHPAGAAYTADADCGGSSTAFDGATTVVTDETLTIAAADIPAASTAFTLTIVPDAALDADDLLLIAVYGKYTGVALT
jgi:hypothetical protein